MSSSRRSSIGRSTCESASTQPWPGKCLPQAAMPALRRPSISAPPVRRPRPDRECNERSPMTLLRPQSRSSTGVNDRSTPRTRAVRRRAHKPARAPRAAPPADPVPQFAETAHRRQAREAVRQRCTLPPSWSMAIGRAGERRHALRSSGARAAAATRSCAQTESGHRPADGTGARVRGRTGWEPGQVDRSSAGRADDFMGKVHDCSMMTKAIA
jgi:hypothetical protein